MYDPFISENFTKYYEQSLISLVDVGASGGLKDTWLNIRKYLNLIGFEPDKKAFDKLQRIKKPGETFFNIAIHNEKAKIRLNLTRKQELASIFEPDRDILNKFPHSQRWDVVGHAQVEADSLDNILLSNKIKDVDALKIDTQGSGLFILEGAKKTLEKTFAVEIETEFIPIYKDQQLFAEIDIYLRNAGFQLFDMRPWYWKREQGKEFGMPRGQLIFADCIYFNTQESVQSILKTYTNEQEQKQKLLHMITISNLFGYFDYSVELFNTSAQLFDKTEKDAFQNFLKNTVWWRTGSSYIGNLEYRHET